MSKNYAGGLITANQNSYYSGLFNGASSYLSVVGAAQYAIATSTTPFTVEAWVNLTASGGLVFSEEYGAPTIVLACSFAASNDVSQPTGLYPAFGWYNGSAWITAAASTTPISLNAWTHVAFVFTGSTSKIYMNGRDVTKTSAPTPATTWGITATNGTNWFVGRRWDTGGSNVYFKGFINNFRFVNGTAVYTGNFAPPTTLAPITNTVLLTCQSSTFVDNSSYATTITNNGGAVISRDNPFYTPSTPALGAATPGVWTISEAAAAAAQRSWPMYDPYFNLTTAMIHGNGANGANNNTFLDSSTNNFTITRNGNTTQGTFTPFSEPDGYWSNYFDGTGDYLTVGGNSNLAFGTSDFSIECWVYMTVFNASASVIYDTRPAGSATGVYPRIQVLTASSKFEYLVGTTSAILSNTLIATNQWFHVAVSRVSGTTRMFINGVTQTATYTDANNYLNGASRPAIGTEGNSIGNDAWDGYISNFRIIKGTGVTSVTVPTAPLTSITNTQLLTCQSNRFVDNSANNFTVTKVGDARTLTYSPFYSPTAYTPAARGGAMYFNGSTSYLATPSTSALSFGTGDFSFELYGYGISFPAVWRFITTPTPFSVNGDTTSGLVKIDLGSGGVSTGITVPSNSWFHFAVTRQSGTVRVFLNGVLGYTVANSTNFSATGITYIGGIAGFSQAWSGYLSNVRVLNGSVPTAYQTTSTTIGASIFTPPTAPLTPITNTQLLLSGTNGSFIDNAVNLTIETVNTTITTSQSKYGGSSMLFNGSTAYANLITPFGNGSNVVQTLGDFTAEAWVYPITNNAQRTIFILNSNTSSYGAVRLDHNASGAVQLLVSTTGAAWAINTTSTTVIPTGSWSHLAVVRAGPSIIVYFNGSPIITSTAVAITTAVMAGTVSYLGVLFNASFSGYFFGALNDFRTTNYARYLGPFIPPTSALQNQ